jgi:prevent-host-death family protein
MPQRYSISDARTSLPAIVDEAEAGRQIELTRRGRPVAVLVSLREFERLRGERVAFADAYKAFLKRYSPAEVGLDADFAESVRETGRGRAVSL